jgi:4-azaleucine resistance transporter AzlC
LGAIFLEVNFLKGKLSAAFSAAFPKTIPIMAGFLFLGMSYGIYMKASGFSFVYPLLMSITIFGGSLEFAAVSMMLQPFAPLQTFLLALMIQARHLFYGLSMLPRFKGTGKKKLYLIFGMCDESFSINCSADIPNGVDKGWFMFFVTLLNQFYWVLGATLGGILGGMVSFNTEGIEFVMTSLFVVIFLENWLKEKRHISSLVGAVSSAVSLVLFGKDSFLIPSMICILVFLALLRRPTEEGVAK